ncbi:MAG: hypothetical protein MJZ02_03430 [Paludibacteraceae bacterium]|nr:hypothetical protein [Paludibacteraceae bacterium]
MKYYSLKKNFFKRVMVMTAMLLVPLFVSAKSLIVKTVADLSELRTDLYEDVSIGADLDFSGIGNWEPIECTKLRIHGNGHTFRNIRSTGSTFGGLFSKVNILRVDSLTILNPIITDFSHSGAFAGWVGSAEFNSCFVNKTAESRITASTYAGGFVGRVSSSVSFDYCGSNMLVNGAKRAGGFVGDCMVEFKFNHCYCNSEVRSSVLSAGFLCGSVSGINSINNCFMGGDVANGYAFVPYTNNSQSDSDFLKNCICEYGRAQYDNTSIGAQLFDYRSIVSGRACWQLNHENYPELETSCVWKQTIGEDVTPMFDGKTVYKKKDGTFSNIDNDVEKTYDVKGFCVEDGSFEKPASKNGSYLIKNYGNLMWFAKEVNAGNSRISATLVNDISCLLFNRKVDWVPIGASPATPYAGSFDGAGYTIESLAAKEGNYQGLFGFLKNAAVSNLNLEGAIVWSNSYAGAIAGYAESSSILNCKVQCQLYAQKYSGGAVGYAKSSTFEKVDVSTQAYALHVFDSDNKNCGFVGYADKCSFNACLNRLRNFGVLNGGSLTNSLSIGSSWTVGTSIPTIDNSYYIVSVATSAYEQTDAQLCSGEVCYKLNRSSEADDVAWRQKVVVNAVNSYPCFTGPVVIKTTACDGTTIVFCNSDTKPNAHSFNRNGVCCFCNNAYQPADENGGCFEISNAGQLCWFSEYQEKHRDDERTRVILLNDILLGTYKKGQSEWKPIPQFKGVFDGQNHTIRGISVDKKSRAGFFDYLAGSAKVQNLILDQGEIRGSDEVGAFTATVSGSAQLINCVNRGIRVEAKNGRAGGLIGFIYSTNSNTYTIENCANFAPVSGNTCGGLASNRVKARGSFTYNTRQMELPLVGGNANYDIVRCFSLSSSDGNLGKTIEQFKSGEVCYLLNDASSENPVWKQMLQADSVPSVLAKYIVYGVKGCNSTEEVEMLFYTNNEAEKDKAQYHSFNQYGLCTKCQTSYQEPLLVNSTYMVSNQGNLCWIAEHSNMVVGKVVLVYDIKLMPENYRMGQQQWNSFVCGFHFDGAGHSISGIDAPLVDSLKANGCITNLNLIDGAILSQDKYVGAFAAVAEGSVSKCVNASVVINGANSQFIGGIVGELNGDSASVAYCANMANVKGYGLVAKVTKGSVERSFCYSENTCVGSGASAASRCFYLLPDKETADGGRTANCFKSGEVCYLLNDSLDKAVWKQDLSKDTIPSLTATQQVFGAFTCHENESERYRVYSNDSNLQDWEHNFADGVCTVCRAGLQEPEHDADGFYLIKKQSELLWFANYLNESSKKNVNARLGDDITLGKDFAWTPISEFSGEFDGNGKSISGLKVNGHVRNGAGFVALLDDGGYIHDLTLKSGSVNAEVETPSQNFGVGAFVGYANLARIEKCVNEGVAVTASNIDAGGIVGYLARSSSITYCADFAAVNSSLHAGCIVGNAASGSITSCFAYGINNSLFGNVNEKSVEINNCYSTNKNDGSYYKPYDKFNNGEVCWLLNDSSSENPIWKQNLNSIVRYPVLSGNYVIYASEKCDGETHYTNNKQYSEIAHIDESKYYKPYGYCPTCNGMEPAYLNDGYYEISKPGHRYWFANMVKSSAGKSVKGKLTGDISCGYVIHVIIVDII